MLDTSFFEESSPFSLQTFYSSVVHLVLLQKKQVFTRSSDHCLRKITAKILSLPPSPCCFLSLACHLCCTKHKLLFAAAP